jgi:hypothetical protein
MKILKNPQAGLSLLGIIVAFFIISFGMVGILSLSNYSLNISSQSKNETIASGLAQEGVEMIRFMRSANVNWADWYDSIVSGNYLVQYNTNSLFEFSETPLKINSLSGLYQYESGNNTIFYRRINLEKISDDEIKVLSEIKWQDKGAWHFLTVEDRLWNWQ